MVRKTEQYGRNAGWTYGVVDGYRRAFKRIGYGFYELFTFTARLIKEPLNLLMSDVARIIALK